MTFFRSLTDLVLYSNLFIALCAASLAYQSMLINGANNIDRHYLYLVFFATILIYSLHRIIGFGKLERITNSRRINVILKFQHHILLYGLLAFVGVTITVFYINWYTVIWLCLPGLLSLLYILPVFGKQKRFRDLPFIKIFAIGLVWTWVSVFIPILSIQKEMNFKQIIFILEKLLFIIAITIPFDIRDMKVDKLHGIKTIPIPLGERKSKYLSLLLLVMAWLLTIVNHMVGYLSWWTWLALTLSYLITSLIVITIREKSHDYYFTGLLDGTILLQLILIYLMNGYFNQ